ncbi:MAG: DUF1329 domain-containing protein, partial [Thermodesulfobacteriota bacterium]|nr:DUF1329 domain-containing protein [Thermodesulfobacteriota bacterium]
MKKIVLLILVLFCMRALLNAENKKEIKNKIRHGKVITKENFKIYEKELKKLLPSSHFLSYENAVKNGWITIPVIKKQKYYPPKGFIDATYKNKGKCKIVPVNQLIGWEAGLPFPDPKNSTELGWNTYRRRQMAEDLEIFFSFFLFNKGIELERTFKIRLWKKFWVGRTDIPPMPELPDNKGVLNSKESIVVSSPYDVKGFSFVRIRYEDITKDDAVFSYIPALRRIRRLTGSDVCDPMLGSDQIYDDFECWREKITSKMTFKKLGVKEFLVPCHYTKKPPQGFRQKNCFQTE